MKILDKTPPLTFQEILELADTGQEVLWRYPKSMTQRKVFQRGVIIHLEEGNIVICTSLTDTAWLTGIIIEQQIRNGDLEIVLQKTRNYDEFSKIIQLIEVQKDGKALYLKNSSIFAQDKFVENPIDALQVTDHEFEDFLKDISYPGKIGGSRSSTEVDVKPELCKFKVTLTKI